MGVILRAAVACTSTAMRVPCGRPPRLGRERRGKSGAEGLRLVWIVEDEDVGTAEPRQQIRGGERRKRQHPKTTTAASASSAATVEPSRSWAYSSAATIAGGAVSAP